MGECRQNMSIWLTIKHLFEFKSSISEKFKYLTRRIDLFDYYFWHDSFGIYINKYIVCPLFGHRKVKYIEKCNTGRPAHHCFKCEQTVDPNYER